jgi:hypothetical protein
VVNSRQGHFVVQKPEYADQDPGEQIEEYENSARHGFAEEKEYEGDDSRADEKTNPDNKKLIGESFGHSMQRINIENDK